MKIAFDKVGVTPKPFSLTQDGVHFEGTLTKGDAHRIVLAGVLRGEMSLVCDRCGTPYVQPIEESLTLQISDRIVEDKDNLDIIEFLDGTINLVYILESETNGLAGDYHYCSECLGSDEALEIEF